MRFKIDENLHADVAALFTHAGHDAQTVADEGLVGCDDTMLASHCRSENRVIVTLDLDFGDVRLFPPEIQPGTIVLRVRNQARRHVMAIIQRVTHVLQTEPVVGRLWVVSESGIRIRGGP